MADRSVKVTLSAQVQDYIAGMDKAAKATRETGSEAEKLAQKRDAFNQLGAAALVMGAGAAAGVGLAVSKWADFDQAMSNVQAATHESEGNMKLLGDAALEAGARTVFSAEESANAIEELAKAGVSTADILNGALDGALDLAAAGGLGVAEAAGIAATALKTFNLEGSEMSHVADLLAAGAGKAMGDVTDLSAALNQSAMVANATGLSIEETTAGLSAFASQGLIGSDAGTSFKSMLQSLTPTSGKAAETMSELGISAYDSQGNFIGLAEFAGNLKNSLKDLTVEQQQAALKTIFGSDAIRAATVLYSEGEEGIREWEAAVNDQGYAAETAAKRLDNLKGDIEALGGALDTALIKSGSGANDTLRQMVQWVTDAIDAYSNLPAPLQGAALGVGVVTAAVGLLGGGLMLGVNRLAEFKIAMATLGVTSGGARNALAGVGRFLGGPLGIALMAATLSVAAFNNAMDGSKVSAQEMENSLKQGVSALDAMSGKATANEQGLTNLFVDVSQHLDNMPALADKAATAGRGFWSSMSSNENAALDSVKSFGDALATLSASDLPAAQSAFKEFVGDAGLNDTQALTLMNEEMVGFKSSLLDAAVAAGVATDDASLLQFALGAVGGAAAESKGATDEQGNSLEKLAGVAADTQEAVADLADEIKSFGSAQFDVEQAAISFNQAFADLQENLDGGAGSLDLTTQAGRDTMSAMLDAAKSTNDYAAATYAMGGSTEDVQGILEAGRQNIINSRIALGDSAEAAKEYADRLIATPTAVETAANFEASAAEQAIANYKASLSSIATSITTAVAATVDVFPKLGEKGSANGNIFAYANGGFSTGIYSGGAPIHKFAEPETGWEAYISGKPSERDRNRQIWVEAGERLGVSPGGGTPNVTVKVENPFTGKYLLGKVVEVVNDGIDASLEQQAQANRKAGQ